MNERTTHIVFQKDAYQPRRMKVFADYLARRVLRQRRQLGV